MKVLHHPIPAHNPSLPFTLSIDCLTRIWTYDRWEPVPESYGLSPSIPVINSYQAPSLNAEHLKMLCLAGEGEIHLVTHPAIAFPNPDDPEEWIYQFKFGAAAYLGDNIFDPPADNTIESLQIALDSLIIDFLDQPEDLCDVNIYPSVIATGATAPSPTTFTITTSSASTGTILAWNGSNNFWVKP